MKQADYFVGIDLGTTHTVVAYQDIKQSHKAKIFEIEQLVAPGEVAAKPLLPCFRYHPSESEIAFEHCILPWQANNVAGDIDEVIIGTWARELGSKVDGHLVSSAKSWLSHPQIDRQADILPWQSDEATAKVSPVVASASYLNYVRQAWNHKFPDQPLEKQQIVVTVPASFDEGARALTLEAAELAGLPQVILLEEPMAACYHWYHHNHKQAQQQLAKNESMLVLDVGGGTTDLSLISISQDAEKQLKLKRIGVGDHLMLGGDNIDLALAKMSEQRIQGGNAQSAKPLSTAALSQLLQQARKAKEALLSADAPESSKVTLLGSGAKLIGGAKSCDLTRDEVEQLAIDGFMPVSDLDQHPDKKRGAIMELGLPFEADPAISKHVAEFLSHQTTNNKIPLPDTLLLNGGFFNSPKLSQRAVEVLSHWSDKESVTLLTNLEPDLAVALGAVAYSRANHEQKLKIDGGSARNFFLMLETKQGQQGICVLPKGQETDDEVILEQHDFNLTLGQPVQFRLTSLSDGQVYAPGDLIAADNERLINLPAITTALEADGEKTSLQVKLACKLTQVGTIELNCLAEDGQRWLLEFEVRRHKAKKYQDFELPQQFEQAAAMIDEVYGKGNKGVDANAVKTLRNRLEKLLGKRDEWDTGLARALFDELLKAHKRRRRSQQHERLWFNLAGFCLRPGFGASLDEWRLEQIWPLYEQGLQFSKDNQSWSDWWTFWRRASGGLTAGQQQKIYNDIKIYLDPAALKNRKLQSQLKNLAYEDMLRLAGSLEQLDKSSKQELGEWFLERLKKSSESQTCWWSLGRLGARQPLYGSLHNVIEAEVVSNWLDTLLAKDWKKQAHVGFAAVMLARPCDDRSRDVNPEYLEKIATQLKQKRCPQSWASLLDSQEAISESESKRLFGEALPQGLRLVD